MDTLLVVEDEKLIRQGIVAMLKRTDVPIGKIVECRNGLEALDIVRTEKVDAIFTDIKMPKMDGIALVEALKSEKEMPLIAVISGYDDFNYAVAMLKSGVMDYILKPIKRDKIMDVVVRMEEKLQKKKMHRQNDVRIAEQQFQELIALGDMHPEAETIWKHICEMLGSNEIAVAAAGAIGSVENTGIAVCDPALVIKDKEGQNVILCSVKDREKAGECLAKNNQGYSFAEGECTSAVKLVEAYREAKQKRCREFVYGSGSQRYDRNEILPLTVQSRREISEKFAQQFPTRHYEKAVKELENMYFHASHGKYDAEEIIDLDRSIWKEMQKNYPELRQEKKDILCFNNIDTYKEYEWSLFEKMRGELQEKMDVDVNQEKVYQAIEFIQKNYHKDLDMATVSNYVSMNYSLFSIVFKEYTGVNFVNYLKNIRIREAKKLLETTDERIQEISRKVGYENEKHFMKTFKMLCGVSPSEYRKNRSLGTTNLEEE